MKLSNTCTLRKQPYKAVISVTNVDCDRTLAGRILMGCDSGSGESNLVPLPTSYPVILDVGHELEGIKVAFYIAGDEPKEICRGSLLVSADVAYNVEINTSSRIFERISGIHALDDMLGVDFKITYINTILFEKEGDPLP